MSFISSSSSTSLATTYRPSSFATVVGQAHVLEVLRRAVVANTVPQQLLFSGGSGLGKTTIARIVAAALLCETDMSLRTRGDSCGTCSACLSVTDGSHPDLIEFDAASHGGKDEVRDIAARCQVMPMRANVKIYIIDEAHGLSTPGGQAFLKILEEPPAHVVFMLCTTDPQRMLKTNRGRCVEFELLPPTHRELLANLERICTGQRWTATASILEAVIDASDPDLGVRGTVTTLAKLGTVLASGSPTSPDAIASLLGVPSPAVVNRLVAAVKAGSRQDALKELHRARVSTPDIVLRHALIRWAQQEVSTALTAPPQILETALMRLESLLECRPGTGWLDLTVARLATTPPSPQSVMQVSTQAATPHATQSADADQSVPSLPLPPASTSATVSSSPVDELSPAAAQLLMAASPATPGMRGLLARCQITISDVAIDLVAPDHLVYAITPMVPALRTAAGRLGLPLHTHKASAIAVLSKTV